jgi:TonB family protein
MTKMAGSKQTTIIKKALSKKYELLEVIGSGSMAVVYKAIQRTLERTVAIKIVHQNLVHDTEFIERFLKEARVAASLNHANIITIHDVDSVDDVHYMTMEFLEGEPLSQMIKREKVLDLEKSVQWIIPIAEALDYLHTKGYIHRDVKSSNIFVSKDDRTVLTDFGIVYTSESLLSQPGTVLGTPEFMSPEQADGKKKLDGRSDLYGLGVILYECVTGKMPFRTDNPLTTVFKVIHEAPIEPVEYNPEVPEWLNSQILNLLSKDPDKRVQTGKELAKNLRSKKVVEFSFDQPKAVMSDGTNVDVDVETSTQRIVIGDDGQVQVEEPPKKSNTLFVGIIATVLVLLISAIVYLSVGGDVESTENDGEIAVIENEFNDPAKLPVGNMDSVYTIVDVHPEFPGGLGALKRFVTDNQNYPQAAAENDVTGRVLVQLIVDTEGRIEDAAIIKGLGSGCDEEALRLVRLLPSFNPGILNGARVRVKLVIPIDFEKT